MPKYGGPISFLRCAYQCEYWTGAECKLMYSLLACYMYSIVLYEIMWILDIYQKKTSMQIRLQQMFSLSVIQVYNHNVKRNLNHRKCMENILLHAG